MRSINKDAASKESVIDQYGLDEDVDPDTKRACSSDSLCCCF